MNLDDVLAGLLADLDATADEQRAADEVASGFGWVAPADRVLIKEVQEDAGR